MIRQPHQEQQNLEEVHHDQQHLQKQQQQLFVHKYENVSHPHVVCFVPPLPRQDNLLSDMMSNNNDQRRDYPSVDNTSTHTHTLNDSFQQIQNNNNHLLQGNVTSQYHGLLQHLIQCRQKGVDPCHQMLSLLLSFVAKQSTSTLPLSIDNTDIIHELLYLLRDSDDYEHVQPTTIEILCHFVTTTKRSTVTDCDVLILDTILDIYWNEEMREYALQILDHYKAILLNNERLCQMAVQRLQDEQISLDEEDDPRICDLIYRLLYTLLGGVATYYDHRHYHLLSVTSKSSNIHPLMMYFPSGSGNSPLWQGMGIQPQQQQPKGNTCGVGGLLLQQTAQAE